MNRKNRRVVATAFGSPEVIEVITETTLPEPQPGQVRIRVEASGAVFTDTFIRRGLYPFLSVEPPFTLGYDVVGVIDKVGEGVTTVQVGQRVADLSQIGGNADYCIRPATHLVPVPDGIDPAEAVSMVLPYITAYQLLHRTAAVQAGQHVLVHGGAGAVGFALTQLARVAGLSVVATSSGSKLPLIEANGALAVDYQNPDLWPTLAGHALNGYDAIVDGIGPANFAGSFALLAPHGILATYGAIGASTGLSHLTSRTPVTEAVVSAVFATMTDLTRVLNALPGNRQVIPYAINYTYPDHPEWFIADLQHLFRLLVAGQIKPLISERLPLEAAVRAHQAIERGEVTGRFIFVNDL